MLELSQCILAKEMITLGYSSKIIASETGLNIKQIRKFYRNIHAKKYPLSLSKPGKDPSGATLIKNLKLKMHASLAMNLYYEVGENSIYQSVNAQALRTACEMYQALMWESGRSEVFNLNDLWYLAQEIRDGNATIEFCECCGFSYFHSIHQRMNADCPFCREEQFCRKKMAHTDC